MAFNPFRLQLHWGDPKHPSEVRAWTGALSFTNGGVMKTSHRYVSHEIARWYGVSYGSSGFVGLQVFGPSGDYSSPVPPRFGPGAQLSDAPDEAFDASAPRPRADGIDPERGRDDG